jgi:maltooligosyltrehalose trehalohydrolase
VTTFEVWAPRATEVDLRLSGGSISDLPMTATADGWWRLDVPEAGPGTRYGFRLDGGDPRPDPRGRRLPDGVHGLSEVYDAAAYPWADTAWTGRALPGTVLYELHIGTFSAVGTFDGAIEHLDHLVELGVDFVEVLPINGFNGVHNWGYDGVAWYAVHEPYGGPDGFKRFVDACHIRGLGVVLDVVYNHLGPSGNYLPEFGPYLKDGRNTWGELVNLDGPNSGPVRRYILDNMLQWLRDFHVDALRLDAVHALSDTSATHLLEQASREVEVMSAHLRRPLTLIAESDLNDPRLVTPRQAGGLGLDAVWDDDVHHELHALLTGERAGYYADFGTPEGLAKVLTGAYLHAGTYSSFRRRVHGRPVDRHNTAGFRFVASLQNHDQIGNRAIGDRIGATLSPGLLRVGAALLLTSPFTPMLFMGEEWGARTPWQFFTSHPEPELGDAVARGRKAEFANHGWTAAEVPDPQDPGTFANSRLDWSESSKPEHAGLLDFYRQLIALRRAVPDLTDPRLDRTAVEYFDYFPERYVLVRRGRHEIIVNLGAERCSIPVPDVDLGQPGALLLASHEGAMLENAELVLPGESCAVVRLADDPFQRYGVASQG